MPRVVTVVAALLAVALLAVPAYILGLTWTGAGGSPADELLTLNTKDSTPLRRGEPRRGQPCRRPGALPGRGEVDDPRNLTR